MFKFKSKILVLSLLCIFINTNINLFADSSLYKYKYKETRALVKLIDNAVYLVNFYGEVAFEDFRKTKGKWRKYGAQMFVCDMAGNCIVNPALPALEGKNLMEVQDDAGRYIVKDCIREVYKYGRDKENGWFHYLWPREDNGKIGWRTTFVARATSPTTGMEYVVGAGMNDMKMEKAFIVDAVNDAVERIRTKGLKIAIETISAKDEDFFFNDTYVFVANEKGEVLANDVFEKINSRISKETSFWEIQDMERKFVFKEFIDIAKSDKRSAWFTSVWESRNKKLSNPIYISTYIRGIEVDNMLYIVGASSELEV